MTQAVTALSLAGLKKPFPKDQIEWRIGQAGKKANGQIWAMCLAYVQARAIQDRLDEVCGPENWRAEYTFIPASDMMDPGVICRLSIKCGDEWVTKEDGAEQTDIESFKGGISAALKRAGSAWGIGRYLYGLESEFANICDRNQGGTYAKTKDGTEFYWLPPNLPSWALPDPSKAKLNGIHPEQPKAGDGVQPATTRNKITSGTFAKYDVSELSLEQLFQKQAILEEKSTLTQDEMIDLHRVKDQIITLQNMEPEESEGSVTAPTCCGKTMMASKYKDPNYQINPWYCMSCKKKVERLMPEAVTA